MSVIHNERTKLTATYFNGAAIAIFAVGSFAPTVASINNNGYGPTASVALVSIICLMFSVVLHLLARKILGALSS